MSPDDISLENIGKMFEYEKFSRDVDNINDIDELKKLTKCYFKLYLKQQEVIVNL